MGNAKSSATSKCGGAQQAAVPLKDARVRARARGQINTQIVQNVLLIWLDNNINDKSTDCHNTVTQLRCAVNTINTFTDGEECIQYLENIDNEKACMIISGALGQHIVPRIH